MHITKRDGRQVPVMFDKITVRIRALCTGLSPDYVDPVSITQKVVEGFYNGITSSQVDTLAAETCAYMSSVIMISQHWPHGSQSLISTRILGLPSQRRADLYSSTWTSRVAMQRSFPRKCGISFKNITSVSMKLWITSVTLLLIILVLKLWRSHISYASTAMSLNGLNICGCASLAVSIRGTLMLSLRRTI